MTSVPLSGASGDLPGGGLRIPPHLFRRSWEDPLEDSYTSGLCSSDGSSAARPWTRPLACSHHLPPLQNMLQVVHTVGLQTQTFPAPLLREPLSQQPPGTRLRVFQVLPAHRAPGSGRRVSRCCLGGTADYPPSSTSARMRQRQRARADGRVRGPAPGGARAPKAEARRKSRVGGGASSVAVPFRRGRARSAPSPVAGCGHLSSGVVSAPLPSPACRRAHGCRPLGLRCCVQRAVSSWARERGSLRA